MGKQINYYMGYEDFCRVALLALDYGCVILRTENGQVSALGGLETVTRECRRYFFWLPESEVNSDKLNNQEMVSGYHETGSRMIEAGYSYVDDAEKRISKGRLFAISGYYDNGGVWIPRPESVTKVYEKLVKAVKKIAVYTELTDTLISMKDDSYLQEYEWKHKEYITPECLELKEVRGYQLK